VLECPAAGVVLGTWEALMPKFIVGVVSGVVLGLFLATMFPDALANVLASVGVSSIP
jgi:hypothetical protein